MVAEKLGNKEKTHVNNSEASLQGSMTYYAPRQQVTTKLRVDA